MAKNATPLFTHINATLATIGGRFGSINDKKTYGVLARAIPDLMTKKGVGNGLRKNLLDNIRIRTGEALDYPETIILTRHQRDYAKRMGWDKVRPFEELFAEGRERNADTDAEPVAERMLKDAELEDAFQQFFSILSAEFQHAFSIVSAKMPRNAVEKLEFFCSTKRNETKVNHKPDMIAASPQAREKPELHSDVEPEQHDGTQPSIIHPEQYEEKIAHLRTPRRTSPHVSIWVKDANGKATASGNLDSNGKAYRLVFGAFDWTMERLNGEGFENAPFRQMLNDTVYPAYRSASCGREYGDLFQTSAVYDYSDSFARKEPVAAEACVALEWSGENQIVGAYLIDGNEITRAEIKKHACGAYKGAFR
ncbi:hypothetical protein [Sphingomonas sp. BAUL-RG-20F-R05-02]|uniref:hypothetical protein n=1 Tax=Sphingomonas sp. BAUL-RG-20F-R05-02 TaxID=2914830 RepID=UPI001F59C9F4|nr:hypothetical protein [Sphingomonas sp. BAUL-RG-20F-R05-02]